MSYNTEGSKLYELLKSGKIVLDQISSYDFLTGEPYETILRLLRLISQNECEVTFVYWEKNIKNCDKIEPIPTLSCIKTYIEKQESFFYVMKALESYIDHHYILASYDEWPIPESE